MNFIKAYFDGVKWAVSCLPPPPALFLWCHLQMFPKAYYTLYFLNSIFSRFCVNCLIQKSKKRFIVSILDRLGQEAKKLIYLETFGVIHSGEEKLLFGGNIFWATLLPRLGVFTAKTCLWNWKFKSHLFVAFCGKNLGMKPL